MVVSGAQVSGKLTDRELPLTLVMGIILDSSILIAAECGGEGVGQLKKGA